MSVARTKPSGKSLPKPGPIALRAAQGAEANVGVHEESENRGRYVKVYLRSVGLRPGEPWCAAFAYYRLAQAALELRKRLPAGFPRSGYCPDYKSWAKESGFWLPASARAFRGDLCLFYFPKIGRIAHMGIVVKPLSSGAFWTVEGNTGPRGAVGEVDRNGDGVYRKLRRRSSLGRYGGFIRLGF